MDLCLIAAGWLDPSFWLAVLLVALGLGFVIFVHELGHFAVAKLCGVRVDKFFIGFDIYGIKLAKFQWGETLYGIGILPLGGYVKMLGQEDNPAEIQKEIERAKQKGGEGEVAAAQQALYDPRSYLAKSVPQRMAIIAAGVTMNMIFALVLAVLAYGWGVRETAPEISQVLPGSGAWQAGIRSGDEVLRVNDQRVRNYESMREKVTLGEVDQPVTLTLRRAGQEIEREIKGQSIGGLRSIGTLASYETFLTTERQSPLALPGTTALEAQSADGQSFRHGDRFVKLDGQPVQSYPEILAYLVLHADKPVEVTVERAAADGKKPDAEAAGRQVTIPVAPMQVRDLGLVMEMGSITALKNDSQAKTQGIQVGDVLVGFDGQPIADPMRLPEEIRKLAGKSVNLTLKREGQKQPVEVELTVGDVSEWSPPQMYRSPVALPGLGIAYRVSSTVRSVTPGSPAEKAGIQAGDKLALAEVLPPEAKAIEELRKKYDMPNLRQDKGDPLKLGDDQPNYPILHDVLQSVLPGTTVKLQWQRDGKDMDAVLEPAAASNWFYAERGWKFEQKRQTVQADSLGEALRLGWNRTADSTLVVFKSLGKIGSGKVSVRQLSGPIGILQMALREARSGTGNLMIFLTFLSANLAVINFLPIPLLDGGQMVLLLWEGVRGKPADERVQVVLAYAGLIFILGLMVLVIGLDLGLIPRPSL